ncbi:amino acid adenylation domain-containing protein [Cohnella soli]|uniref:Amino acid adenylation domain-containing protein n=1 Tax=Cohnella soli TaxID=425005 RepID=A0ABW0HSN0_9BACL
MKARDLRSKEGGDFLTMLPDDFEKITRIFNDTNMDWGDRDNQSIIQFFEQSVERSPEAAAIKFEGRVITYSELNKTVNRWARKLSEWGIREGELVPIIMDRSPEMIQMILALWKLGAAYIPVDPEYPAERILFIISDCRAIRVIMDSNIHVLLPEGIQAVKIAQLIDESNGMAEDNISRQVLNEELAYVIYTSGTTGRPKGVMIEHQGMINHILAKVRDLNLTENSRVAQTASAFFDISVWQFFSALIVGGCTVIYGRDLLLNIAQFLRTIQSDGIHILEVVPSYLTAMNRWMQCKPSLLPGLKYVLVTGEVLKPNTVEEWFALHPSIPLVNAYGPTEASDDITHHFISQPCADKVPIGKPIHNMQIYIVDRNRDLCPIGVKGEIVVSGVGVGRGYLNDVIKTDLSFIWLDLTGTGRRTRYYCTGDIGCWTEEGTILYFGRKDDQVKIRGYRIELSEVDHALIRCEGVEDAVSVALNSEHFGKTIVAFVVSHAGNLAEVKEQLNSYLPNYMIPERIEAVESFPLNENGKVDKKKLIDFLKNREVTCDGKK